MSESLQERWVQIALSAIMIWCGWLTIRSISLDAQLATTIQTQSNVIPPVIEASFKEIREKGNVEAKTVNDALVILTKMATENGKDIGYIKESIAKLKP